MSSASWSMDCFACSSAILHPHQARQTGTAGRQQGTTAKADSAAEYRCLLRPFTRTIRAGETAQQTAVSGVACAANARMRRSSRQRQEAGQCEEGEGTGHVTFLRCI